MNIIYSAVDVELAGAHGGSSHVVEVLESLSRMGHRVYVIAKGRPERKIKNVEVFSLPFQFKNGIVKNLAYMFFSFLFSLSLLLTKKIDLVYERARIFGGCPVFLSLIFRKPSVIEENEPLLFQINEIKNPLFRSLLKTWFLFIINKASLVTVTHPSMGAGIIKKEKILLINYGTDPDKFNPQVDCSEIRKKYGLKKGKTVLYTGSFREWHALKEMILAAREIYKKDKEVRFLFVGEGEKFEECKKMAKKFKLKNVIFTGRVPHEKMPAYINASDICLALFNPDFKLFKKCDYFFSPIKVHEYKACGKPIVASDMGNLRELVKHKLNGMLVNPKNVGEIVNAIIFLLENRRVAKNMGERNRKEVLESYNWDRINERIISEVKRVK